jgi:Flp pilus assembly protein TadG
MNNKRRYSGASLVEFVLILPLFLFLTTGFLDLGRAVFYYSSLTNAVRESTRYAIVHRDDLNSAYINPTNNSLQDKVLEYAFGLTEVPDPLTKANIFVTVEKVKESYMTVTIEAIYLYKPITPGMKQLFGTSEGIELTVQSKMFVTPGAK